MYESSVRFLNMILFGLDSSGPVNHCYHLHGKTCLKKEISSLQTLGAFYFTTKQNEFLKICINDVSRS